MPLAGRLHEVLDAGGAVEMRLFRRRAEPEDRPAGGILDHDRDEICAALMPIHAVAEPAAVVAMGDHLGKERLTRISQAAYQVRVVDVEMPVLEPGDNSLGELLLQVGCEAREIFRAPQAQVFVEKRLAARRDSRDLRGPLRRELASDFRNWASFFGSNVSGSNASKSLCASGEDSSSVLPSILKCCFMLSHSTFPPHNVPVNFDLVPEMFLQDIPEHW